MQSLRQARKQQEILKTLTGFETRVVEPAGKGHGRGQGQQQEDTTLIDYEEGNWGTPCTCKSIGLQGTFPWARSLTANLLVLTL